MSNVASTHYLMAWIGKHVIIAGPFLTKDDAAKAGENWQEVHEDNPCWQVLSDRSAADVTIQHISAAIAMGDRS